MAHPCLKPRLSVSCVGVGQSEHDPARGTATCICSSDNYGMPNARPCAEHCGGSGNVKVKERQPRGALDSGNRVLRDDTFSVDQ